MSGAVREREGPGPFALALLGVWAALLALAPTESNAFWGVNGLRSLGGEGMALVVAVALVVGALAAAGPRSRLPWASLAVALAVVVAFPLRERIHFLGDTQLRLRALQAAGAGMLPAVFADWWGRLHANPLDLAVNVAGPLALGAAGLPMGAALSTVSLLLALAHLGGAFRLAGRLGVPVALQGPLALALATSGVLEAFAGYADSAGLVAAAAMWWWAGMLAPLDRPGRAGWAAAAFAVLLLSHRAAFLMLVPQLLRALGPALPGDQMGPRRLLLALTLGGTALAAALAVGAGAARQLSADAAELLRSARGFQGSPADLLNTLALVAPLAVLAPVVAGRALGAARDPRLLWIAAAALPLLVLQAWLFPAGESGLGAHRDWDAAVLLGVTLTIAGGLVLARLGALRLRTALALVLPLLAAGALGWVAANADPATATRRALTLERQPSGLTRAQRSHLHAYFGQRAMDLRRPDVAAPHWEQAHALSGNPRRALLAAEAWLLAGNREAARGALERARGAGALSAELDSSARLLERALDGAP
jgi:hypothetical protein